MNPKTSRYRRVQHILDAAHRGSAATYQGLGEFWNRPLEELLCASLYGVRLIAPGEAGAAGEAASSCGAPTGGGCSHRKGAAAVEPPSSSGARGASSGLIRGLKGEFPFDGTQFPRLMWGGSEVSGDDIRFIEAWIDAGCPAEDDPKERRIEPGTDWEALAGGRAQHPPSEEHFNDRRAKDDAVKVRKDVDCLTPAELQRFRDALQGMYRWNDFPQDQRGFTFWASIHADACQHGWEEFLPWHRLYLYNMELFLQENDSSVTLPYWNWTTTYEANRAVTTPDTGIIPDAYHCWLTEENLATLSQQGVPSAALNQLRGAIGTTYNSWTRLYQAAGLQYAGSSTDGVIFNQLLANNPMWHRNRWPGGGSSEGSSLLFENYPAPQDIDRILEITDFFKFGSGPDDNHYFGACENVHNLMHNFSGGQRPTLPTDQAPPENGGLPSTKWPGGDTLPEAGDMVNPGFTAYDPIFWGHHSNVDRLWYEWQKKHPGVNPDNPYAPLPPFDGNVQSSLNAEKLGYEYVQSSTHFPADASVPYTAFRSAKAGTHPKSVKAHARAEVRVHGLRYRSTGGIVRCFVNADDADATTATRGNDTFVGQFHTFAGDCVGGEGHCAPPPSRAGRSRFDNRKRHRKTPGVIRFDATETIKKLCAGGATDFHVHLVVLGFDGKPNTDVLRMDGVSLNFFD